MTIRTALRRSTGGRPVVRHLHASGRWDRPEALLDVDLDMWIRSVDPDVATLTEAGDCGRGRALERPGWHRVQAKPGVGRDECALGYSTAVLQMVAWESVPVSPRTYVRANGKRSPRFFALNVALRLVEAPDEIIVFSVLHAPSAVDSPTGFRAGPRALVYRAVTAGWRIKAGRFTRRIRKHARTNHPGTRVHKVLVADFNLHLLRAWARAYLRRTFGPMAMTWDRIKPNRGTHGWRVIDGALASRWLRVIGAHVLRTSRSSDHRTFWQDLEVQPHP